MQKAATFPAIPVSAGRLRWLAWIALAVAAYWLVLSYVYIHSISPINATDAFLYLRIDAAKVAEGALWGALLLPTIDGDWKRPSQFGLTILYLIGLVPSLILFGLSDQPRWEIYTIIAGYVAAFAGARLPVSIPRLRLRAGPRTAIYIAAGISAFIVLWFFAMGAASFNIDLLAVYRYREQANSAFEFGPMAYLAAWTSRVMLPFCMSYFLYRRQWPAFAAAVFFQLFCLVIFQEKSVLIPCVILASLYTAPKGRAALVWLIAAFIASIAICELVYDLTDNYLLLQLWPRRFFFVQEFLYFSYMDVFSKIGLVYYSDSFMHWLMHYPFPDFPAAMVQYYAMGKLDGNPNTGFLGAGYMELGVLGVVLNGFAAGFILRLFDRAGPRNMPLWFFGTFAFLPLYAMLIAQNFVTSLLTGGVGAAMLLLLLTQLEEFNPSIPAGKSPARKRA